MYVRLPHESGRTRPQDPILKRAARRAHSVMAGSRAVVLGCGVAGVAAAAALRGRFDEVVIFERDTLPSSPEPRRGVPQANQLHNLLTRAQWHLEELLPGFCNRLRDAGAGEAVVSVDTHVFELGIRMPERDLGLRLMCAWRPTIEHVAREALGGVDVAIRDNSRAVGLEAADHTGVSAVWVATGAARERIATALVVDASGSGSQGPEWLKALGYPAPAVDTAKVDQWYATMVVRRPAEWVGKSKFWLVFPTPPRTRGGLVSPVGTHQWYVSLSGHSADEPPRTAIAMRRYAASLEDPVVADILADAEVITEPKLFRRPVAAWRRYDLLRRPLPGYLPIGDAVASLNPLFGQGVSVAAWQAAELSQLLDANNIVPGDPTWISEYLKRSARVCMAAWTLGSVVDKFLTGGEAAEFAHGDLRRALARVVRDDPEIHRRYVGMWHLIEPAANFANGALSARLIEAARAPRCD